MPEQNQQEPSGAAAIQQSAGKAETGKAETGKAATGSKAKSDPGHDSIRELAERIIVAEMALRPGRRFERDPVGTMAEAIAQATIMLEAYPRAEVAAVPKIEEARAKMKRDHPEPKTEPAPEADPNPDTNPTPAG